MSSNKIIIKQIDNFFTNILLVNFKQVSLLLLLFQVFGISFYISSQNDWFVLIFLIFYLIFSIKTNYESVKIYFLHIIFAGFLIGIISVAIKLYQNKTEMLNGEYLIEGIVTEIKPRQDEMILTVNVNFINTFACNKIKKVLISTDNKITNNFMIGTNIIFSAKLRNFQYNSFLNQNRNNLQYLINGIAGIGKMTHLYFIEEKTIGFLGFIYKIRKNIYDILVDKMGTNGHFIAALVLGETGKISSEIIDDARKTGVSHILCVSGLHLSIVCFIFFKVARVFLNCFNFVAFSFNIKKICAVIAVIASVLFLLLSGSQIASTRACIMTSLAVIGILLDRIVLSVRVVFFTGLCMLLFYPEYLYHPSFQLSYIAVIGIISSEKFSATVKDFFLYIKSMKYSKHQKLVAHLEDPEIRKQIDYSFLSNFFEYCKTNIYITFLVSLITLPIVLYHFYYFSNYSIIANLIIVPIASFILMPLSILAIILIPFNLSGFVFYLLNIAVNIVIYIMHYIARLPYCVSYFGYIPYYLMSISIIFYLLFLIFKSRIRLFFLLFFICSIFAIFFISRPKIIISHNMIIVNQEKIEIYAKKYNKTFFNKIANWLGKQTYTYMGDLPYELKIDKYIIINYPISNSNNNINIDQEINKNSKDSDINQDQNKTKDKKIIINLYNNLKYKPEDISYDQIIEKELILY